MSNDAFSSSSSPPHPPQHLSEFYSFVNPGLQSPAFSGTNDDQRERLPYNHSRNNSNVSFEAAVNRNRLGGFIGVASGAPGSGSGSGPSSARGSASGPSMVGIGSRSTPTPTPPPGLPQDNSWRFTNLFRKPSLASLQTVDSTLASSFAANVANNHPDLPALITSNEITNTINTYQTLLDSAAKYKEAILVMAKASADFGQSLEACSRCKGAGSSSDGLQSAGGLHYLVANHQQILAKSITSAFEIPVKKQLESFKQLTKENEQDFKLQLREKTRNLKRRELETQKMAYKRIRNLAEYRNSLLELTSLVDDIDRLKYSYFQSLYESTEANSNEILQYAASIVRAQIEIYEGIARKGWSGGGLEDLISSCPDPFSIEGEGEGEEEEENDENASKFSIYGLIAGSGASKAVDGGNNSSFSGGTNRTAPTTPNLKRSETSSSRKNQQIFSILPTNSILPQPKDDENDTIKINNRKNSHVSDDDTDDDHGHEYDSDNDHDSDLDQTVNIHSPSQSQTPSINQSHQNDSFYIEESGHSLHKSLSDRMLTSQNWKSQEGFPKDDMILPSDDTSNNLNLNQNIDNLNLGIPPHIITDKTANSTPNSASDLASDSTSDLNHPLPPDITSSILTSTPKKYDDDDLERIKSPHQHMEDNVYPF